jgi:hypothetical protein
MVTAAATSVRHLYVIRFFQGMAEASTFVGAVITISLRFNKPLTGDTAFHYGNGGF